MALCAWLGGIALPITPTWGQPAARRGHAEVAPRSAGARGAQREEEAPGGDREARWRRGKADARQSEREADARLAAGLAHYEQRQFERAIEAFAAGYRVAPRPEFLFALAQAERRSGDCRSALVYYRAFLDTGPSVRQIEAARTHIAGCRAALASTPQIAQVTARDGDHPVASLSGSPPGEEADARGDGPTSSPWYRDRLAGGLMIAGLTAGGAGAGLLYVSRTTAADAATARSPSEHDAAVTSARRYRALALGSLAVGSALVVGAIWRYVAHDDAGTRVPLTVAPAAGGLALAIGGRF